MEVGGVWYYLWRIQIPPRIHLKGEETGSGAMLNVNSNCAYTPPSHHSPTVNRPSSIFYREISQYTGVPMAINGRCKLLQMKTDCLLNPNQSPCLLRNVPTIPVIPGCLPVRTPIIFNLREGLVRGRNSKALIKRSLYWQITKRDVGDGTW
jgi:hypothetical protein